MPHLKFLSVAVLIGVSINPVYAVETLVPSTSTPWVNGTTDADFSHWGLTPEEQKNYLSVAKIEQAFSDISKLSPFEVLGKFAQNDADRRHYAKRFVAAMVDNQRRALEWSIAVADEIAKEDQGKKLLSSPLIRGYLSDIGYTEPSKKVIPVIGSTMGHIEKRLTLFIAANDCDSCDSAFRDAFDKLDTGKYNGIDVVFVGMKIENRKAATQWAMKNGITADMVEQRKITLNVESDALNAIQQNRAIPVAIDNTNGQVVTL